MKTKTTDPTAKLAELRATAARAEAAEEQARAEHAALQRAVGLARAAVQAAYTTGDEQAQAAAHDDLTRAQEAAERSGRAYHERTAGLAQARRAAQAAVNTFAAENLTDLVEAIRPDAEAAVAQVRERIADLQQALHEYTGIEQRIAVIAGPVQWFRAYERMPADPFAALRVELEVVAAGEIPAPMPSSTLDPAAEAERVAALGAAALRESDDNWQPFRRAAA